MIIHEQLPWRELTRNGIPPLKVARQCIRLSGEVTVPVGAILNPELIPAQIRAERLRQFYEARRLEPLQPPPNTRQYYRDKANAAAQAATVTEPIVPVASQIVADLPELPVIDDEPVVEQPAVRDRPPRKPAPRERLPYVQHSESDYDDSAHHFAPPEGIDKGHQ